MREAGSSAPADDPVAAILSRIEAAEGWYHRLILVAGAGGSGKSAALRAVAQATGAPVLNLNLELSRRLLELTARQRVLRLPGLLDELIPGDRSPVLLDNTELLFEPALRTDPLKLLQGAARNRTVVAAWNGALAGGWLTCAELGHPEYRRYPQDGMVIVSLGTVP